MLGRFVEMFDWIHECLVYSVRGLIEFFLHWQLHRKKARGRNGNRNWSSIKRCFATGYDDIVTGSVGNGSSGGAGYARWFWFNDARDSFGSWL